MVSHLVGRYQNSWQFGIANKWSKVYQGFGWRKKMGTFCIIFRHV